MGCLFLLFPTVLNLVTHTSLPCPTSVSSSYFAIHASFSMEAWKEMENQPVSNVSQLLQEKMLVEFISFLFFLLPWWCSFEGYNFSLLLMKIRCSKGPPNLRQQHGFSNIFNVFKKVIWFNTYVQACSWCAYWTFREPILVRNNFKNWSRKDCDTWTFMKKVREVHAWLKSLMFEVKKWHNRYRKPIIN